MALQDKMILVGLLMTLMACGQKKPLLLAETKTPEETVKQQVDSTVEKSEKSEKVPEKLVKQPEKNQQEQYQ